MRDHTPPPAPVGDRQNPWLRAALLEQTAREPSAELWGDDGERLAERGASVEALHATVAARTLAAPAPDPLVLAAVDRLARRPNARVSSVATDLAISERQLRRRFHAAVGY